MPIYEYQCAACNHHLDALQKMSEAALTECPACHRPALQKIMSATSFQLKGTGWYATDFKNQPKNDSKTETGTTVTETKPPVSTGSPAAAAPSAEKPAAAETTTKTEK